MSEVYFRKLARRYPQLYGHHVPGFLRTLKQRQKQAKDIPLQSPATDIIKSGNGGSLFEPLLTLANALVSHRDKPEPEPSLVTFYEARDMAKLRFRHEFFKDGKKIEEHICNLFCMHKISDGSPDNTVQSQMLADPSENEMSHA